MADREPSRNSLAYPRGEVDWYAEQARMTGSGPTGTLVGWLYFGPILVLVLSWWLLTRLVGVPYGIVRRIVAMIR